MTQENNRWSKKYPELGEGPIPVEPYVSEEIYDQEVEKIFKKTWLKVGRDDELPKPGDYKVKKIGFAKTSIIMIRGKDGRVRGFHNVCSHRGNKVIVETGEETFGGRKSALMTCRFHGWVYDAEGQIVNLPEEEKFSPCFEKEENGLTPVHIDVWEGFIFINLDPGEVTPLKEYLGELGDHMSGFPYDKLTKGYRYYTYLDCNWKVAHDAFAEAYHVETIHAGSFPNIFSTGLQNVQLLGDHRATAVCMNIDGGETPVAKIATAKSRSSLVKRAESSMLPPGINPDKREDFGFELSVIFPNLLLHVSEGIWFLHQFWPLANNQTLWEGQYFVKEPETNSERWAQESAIVLQRNAWLEDTATMEATQIALESGAKKFMHLQDDEILIRHGFHVVEKYLEL
ncbi:MAG: (2Fe-2S)-binding protein [Alphaproteobacteria bacterium]|nr:MAG: (2Fe-2S)-binding protein [Alphaproteobacteria bacterium]